jgi:hypothetical protein
MVEGSHLGVSRSLHSDYMFRYWSSLAKTARLVPQRFSL